MRVEPPLRVVYGGAPTATPPSMRPIPARYRASPVTRRSRRPGFRLARRLGACAASDEYEGMIP